MLASQTSHPLAGLAVWDCVVFLLVSMNKCHCVIKFFQKQNVCCVCQIGCSFRSGSTLPTPHSSFSAVRAHSLGTDGASGPVVCGAGPEGARPPGSGLGQGRCWSSSEPSPGTGRCR